MKSIVWGDLRGMGDGFAVPDLTTLYPAQPSQPSNAQQFTTFAAQGNDAQQFASFAAQANDPGTVAATTDFGQPGDMLLVPTPQGVVQVPSPNITPRPAFNLSAWLSAPVYPGWPSNGTVLGGAVAAAVLFGMLKRGRRR